MNKFVIVALVAFAGVASANLHKFHGSRHNLDGEDFGEFEPNQGVIGGRFHDSDEDLGHSLRHGFDETRHGLGGHFGHGGIGGIGKSSLGHGLRHGLGHGLGHHNHEGSRIGHQGDFGHGGFGNNEFSHQGLSNFGKGKSFVNRHGRLGRRNGFNRHAGLNKPIGGGFNRHGDSNQEGFGNKHSSGFEGIGNRHGSSLENSGIGGGFNRHGDSNQEGFGNKHNSGCEGIGNRHGSSLENSGIGGGFGRRHGSRNRNRFGGVGGAGIGAGAIGAARGESAIEGGLGGSTHSESNTGLEGHQGASIEGEGHFDAGNSRADHNDIEKLRQHQVINKNKTIIKDNTSGVNDVDAIRHSTGNNEDGFIGAGISAGAQENAGASLTNNKEFDHEFGAGGAAESSLEAAGAAGIGSAGVGAGGLN